MYGLDKAGKKEESGMTRTNSAGLLSPQPKKEKPTSEKHGVRVQRVEGVCAVVQMVCAKLMLMLCSFVVASDHYLACLAQAET